LQEETVRNPHAGEPFTDGDGDIAAALEDVSVPALLCSLVHMTGDPSWIRGPHRPRGGAMFDLQGGLSDDARAEVRRAALPVVAAYRDGGCVPARLDPELLVEMMSFLGARPVDGAIADFFLEDLHFDGADSGAEQWGDEVPDDVKATSPVVVIGCGMGGILAGIRLRQAGLPFTILDKNAGPGGTWWENRYPGARVDVGSHQYCYSFEPADHWSEYYCQHPELRDYFTRILDKYGLREHCRFGTEVTSVTWDDDAARWHVRTRAAGAGGTDDVLDARFVISAVGSLNLPRLPDIVGMESFAGPSFHSARWPDDLDITGTRFALVGAGASGFQIAPTIADTVATLTIFQRTAQWMLPNPMYHRAVPAGEQWAARHLPFYGRWLRFLMTFPGVAAGVDPYRVDPSFDDPDGHAVNAAHAKRAAALRAWLLSFVEDRPDLVDKVVPDYPAMGKRILQDNGSWMRCLKKPNVELVRTAIDRIVPEGVVTADGTLHPADVICYATGFRHNEFLAPMEVTGRGGVTLRDQWGDEPTAYLGITTPNFPNLFMLYGPGTNLAHSASLFLHSEFQVHYTMDAIHRVLAAGARSIEVREDAHADYVARYEREIGQLVWSHPSITHSHYKNPAGRVYTLSPWPIVTYWEWTRAVDPGDYVIT
jgi:4-hydroxyacetophenone monooxygenase